ncbi:MAG: hypothetical protein Q9181_005370 [Wetmoreana brouardii]
MAQPTVNGDVRSSKFLDRLTSFPAVSSGIDAVKSNPITAAPLQMTKRTTSLFATPVFPLASLSYFVLEPLIQPMMKKLDAVAHESLVRIESTWPMITEEPGKIKTEVKYLLFLPWTKAKEQKDYVYSIYSVECSERGGSGVMTKGRAVICTQLIVLSDGLLWIRSILNGGQKQAKFQYSSIALWRRAIPDRTTQVIPVLVVDTRPIGRWVKRPLKTETQFGHLIDPHLVVFPYPQVKPRTKINLLSLLLTMFESIYRSLWRTLAKPNNNYELELQVAEMRKQPAYVPEDIPPPTIFPIKCHPKANEVCAELDEYFYTNWPWKDEATGQKFLRSETNRWACLALPNAKDDRIKDAVRVNTLLFLLDDVAEDLSVSEGKDLYNRLTPLALGKALPNRNDPYEWMTYDIWTSMRKTDAELTDVVWQGAQLCIMAQVDEARMKCPDMGSLLKHRAKEAGIAFVAAVLRFSQSLHLTAHDISSISAIHTSYALLGVTVNDILSFDKELRAHSHSQSEGSYLLNMTLALANDTELGEWEVSWKEQVRDRREKEDSVTVGDRRGRIEEALGGAQLLLIGYQEDFEDCVKSAATLIMFFDIVKRLISAIKDRLYQSATILKRSSSRRTKVPSKDAETNCKPEHAPIVDYLDVGVQVNESMLFKEDREFPLIISMDKDTQSYKAAKVVIHQDSRRPEIIPEETSDDGSRIGEQQTASSSSVGPKSALKGSSRQGSSADSLASSKTSSDSGSSRSKKVSWEQVSVRREQEESNENLADSTSGAGTPAQARGSDETQSKRVRTEVSGKVLELLPASDRTAFETFRRLCANKGLLDRPAGFGKRDLQEGVNDDATLFRFFTARKCDIHEAYNQFQEAHATREANDVLGFFNRMDVDDYEETRKLYPHWVGRRDKRGLPICIFDFGKLDSKTMNAYRRASASIHGMSIDPKAEHAVSPELLRSSVVYDSLTRFVLPLCSGTPGGPDPVHKTLQLVDITGIGIRQVWNLRSYVQDLARLLSRNYPEILDHVFIIGAPTYFSTIWGWIKNWVDPGTVEKLQVLSHAEVLPTLKEYIDLANIPTRFGGQFKYEIGMSYDLDPVIARRLVWPPGSEEKFPMGPVKWTQTDDGCKLAIAVGSQGGKERSQKLAVIR